MPCSVFIFTDLKRKVKSQRVVMQINSNLTMNRIKPEKFVKIGFSNSCISQNTHSQLNFKGQAKYSELAERFGEDFGQAAKEYFEEIIEKAKHHGLEVHNDEIKFPKETLSQKALDILSYPIMQMPFDFANAMIDGLKKIPGIKNLSLIKYLDNSKLLNKKREFANSKSHIAAIKHYLELLEKGEGEKGYLKRFAEGHTRLKPLMPNYNSESERSLTRIVTGLIPAFFLANDAYNLSMYMNNDKDAAKKAKQRRFNQEVTRIGITAAATYGVMSFFSKHTNKYMGAAIGLNAGIVLISEFVGRLMAGNPVLPVTAKEAKEYAQKRKEIKQNKPEENKTENKTKPSLLNTKNILTAIAGLIVFGFVADKTSKTKFVSERLAKLSEKYKGLYTKPDTIEREVFDRLMDKLHDNGFKKLAYYYEDAVRKQTGNIIKLGTKDNKIKQVIIHQILAFPLRFIWQAINLPYKIISGSVIKLPGKGAKADKEISKMEILQNSLKFLEKIENDKPEEFTRKVNEKLVASFDNLTKSKYSNADLSTAIRITSNVITSGFLIADNYNLVMIDSQGNDKDLAEQKGKERALQRFARIIYAAFITKMTNDVFKGTYNSSLLGAQVVNVGNTLLTETLERKSVGLPLHEATREEIKENETNHLNATGAKGSYFRAMAALTGKKTFAQKEENNKTS